MKSSSVKQSLDSYRHLISLPRDREVLDFVKQKLEENDNPQRLEVLSKLMEMYRTSAGFDPVSLSRARFKRIKPSEFRKILESIDKDIEQITGTDDYKNLVRSKLSGSEMLRKFIDVSFRLREGEEEIKAEEIEHLKKNLVEREEYDLLVSFYKSAQRWYLKQHPDMSGKVIEEFRQVHTMAQLSYEHVLAGYRTQKLIDDAASGKRVQAELHELYQHLSRLIMQYLSPVAKYQNLIRILRISLHMHSRRQHLEPYLEFAAQHFDEIASLLPDQTDHLASVLCLYLNREPLHVREHFIERAFSSAAKNSLEKSLILEITRAELYLDTLNISEADTLLDDCYKLTDGVLESNKHLYRISWNRFLIELSKSATVKNPDAISRAEQLLDSIELAGRERKDNTIRSLELKGMLLTAQDNFSSARTIFNEAFSYRETYPDAVFSIVDKFFVRLLSSYADADHLDSMIEDLERLNEPVYSTLLASVMKVMLQKRSKVVVSEFE